MHYKHKIAQNARKMRNLSREECSTAIALVGEGLPQVTLAQRLGVTQSTISKAIARFRETGSYERRPRMA